ncbi:MAG: hypothetical protein QW210_02880 [Candidatus Woesearchaeota archaeon]
MKFLNSKEKKELLKNINDYFQSSFETEDKIFITNQDKIYLVSKAIENIDIDKIKIRNIGLYFGQIMQGTIRLSVEGSQLVGKTAKRNILEANKELLEKLKEEKFEISCNDGYYLVKFRDHFLGCIYVKNNQAYNYIPKARRNWN